MSSWWTTPENDSLAQGELLRDCMIPTVDSGPEEGKRPTIRYNKADCIIITQSCDLENKNLEDVILCLCQPIDELRTIAEKYNDKGHLEKIRKGEVFANCMLQPIDPEDGSEKSLIVDFKAIISLSQKMIRDHLSKSGHNRTCLNSPYTEHLSQAFAKFFMRVALPEPIESFKPSKKKHSR